MLNHEIEGRKITINCHSQSAIRAINSTVIKTNTTGNAKVALNTLGVANEVTLQWIPAHRGFEDNKLADHLAKRGSNNESAIRVQLSVPRCVCYAALKRKTCNRWAEAYKLKQSKIFNML